MILVIGGYAQGKRSWVERSLTIPASEFTCDPFDTSARVLYGLEDCAERVTVADLMHFDVVICTEIGMGIVPVDPQERARRETVGRLCIELARKSTCVVRVVCGIGTVIAGELPEPATGVRS